MKRPYTNNQSNRSNAEVSGFNLRSRYESINGITGMATAIAIVFGSFKIGSIKKIV